MLTLLIAALAAWQIIEIWHHSELLANKRAEAEARGDMLGKLLACPFCLGPWVSLLCLIVLAIPEVWHIGFLLQAAVKSMAASRLANIGNDLFYDFSRTPKIAAGLTAPEDIESDDNESQREDIETSVKPQEPTEPTLRAELSSE